jgi:hypothetical protein
MSNGDLSRHKPPLRFGLFVRADKFYWGQGEKYKPRAESPILKNQLRSDWLLC